MQTTSIWIATVACAWLAGSGPVFAQEVRAEPQADLKTPPVVLAEVPANSDAAPLQSDKAPLFTQPFHATRAIRIVAASGKLKEGQVLSGLETERGWMYCPPAGISRAPCYTDDDGDGTLDRALSRPMTARNGFWLAAISGAGDMRGIYLANAAPLDTKARYEVIAPELGLAGKYAIYWRLEKGSEANQQVLVLWSKVGEFNSTTFNYGIGPTGAPGISGASVVRRTIGEGESRFPLATRQATEVDYHGLRLRVDPPSTIGNLTYRILGAPQRTVRFSVPGFSG